MNKIIIAALASTSLLAACTSGRDGFTTTQAYGSTGSPRIENAGEDGDEAIALDQIPAAVRAAALARFPGLVITAAERETEDGAVQYSLEGNVGGVKHELEVSPDGHTVHVEGDGDDDDDDDDDGDDN